MCSRRPPQQSLPVGKAGSADAGDTLRPLQWLLGTWRGQGRGYYPTIQGFAYGEELLFSLVAGKPTLVTYAQRTWNAADPAHPLMHAETGYLRLLPPQRVELLVCDPTGVAQVYEGEVDAEKQRLTLATTHVTTTSSAKEVKALQRTYHLDPSDDGSVKLRYEVHMEAVGQPMQQHLEGELAKADFLELSPQELKADQKEFTIVDVREKDEYDQGHIEGALNMPLGHLITTIDRDLQRVEASMPHQRVVVYCRQGYRAALAQQEMRRLGLSKTVYNLQGGWEGWQQQSL